MSQAPMNAIKGFTQTMLHVIATAAFVYLVVLVMMYVLQRNFLYFPESYVPTPAQSGMADMDVVRFQSEDGVDLFAWAKPPSQAGKPWVVIFHGNAGTLAGRGHKARAFLDQGYGVLLVEYRGFGGIAGKPTEAGLFADARAALAHIRSQGAASKDMVLYGESLGTGVAVAMAFEAAQADQPVAAVLLEAPFTSTDAVAAGYYPFLPVRMLMKDRFDSLSRIKDIATPVFVVHGDKDKTVPQSLGRKLFSAAVEPKDALWIEGAGHNDLTDHGMIQAMLVFLNRHSI